MTIDNRLCIIPCGSAKVWDKNPNAGPQLAKDVYRGVFSAACQRYAEAFFVHWVILSAKHGFLLPDDIIEETYNVSFVKPTSDTITIEDLHNQAKTKGLLHYQEITVLGGKHYVSRAKEIFNQGQDLSLPLADCRGIGYMLQRLTNTLKSDDQVAAAAGVKTANTKVKMVVDSDAPQVGKYLQLYNFLKVCQEETVVLSMEQLEAISGFEFPNSATKHRAWWANHISNTQGKSWLYAGWEVDSIHLPSITFRRIDID
jgi:hypothetical protein